MDVINGDMEGKVDRMSGHRLFSELTRNFTPERRRRIDDMKAELLAEMPLHELHRARRLASGTSLRS